MFENTLHAFVKSWSDDEHGGRGKNEDKIDDECIKHKA